MSDIHTPLSPADQAIVDEYDRLYSGSYDAARALEFALERGGSLDLIGRAAQSCYTCSPAGIVKLPYIASLLAAGYDQAAVRELFVRLSLSQSEEAQYYHCLGFWDDQSAMRLFDTAESLLTYASANAEIAPERALGNDERLALELGRRRCPDLRYEHEQIEVGRADARVVLMKAARHINRLMTDHQLEVLLELPVANLAHAATQHCCDPRGLILKGFVLAGSGTSRQELMWIMPGLYQEITKRPERAPEIYRWVLEGMRRASGEQYWQFNHHVTELRAFVEGAGWKFERLTSRDNPRRPNRPDLQVELRDRSGQTVFKHIKTDASADLLREGDEVIVSTKHVGKLSEVFRKGTFRILSGELIGASPANSVMQDHQKRYSRFYYSD